MAIALAKEGGLGVIHKNMSIERQTEEVEQGQALGQRHHRRPGHAAARRHRSARPSELMEQHNVSGVPITDNGRQAGGHSHPPRSAVSREQRPAASAR